ncbi:riboflavin synthase [Magnetospirillum gryphiswaldense]|uniref:Riboflavin synthase n=1 Tax=Magnetospirillum gryphiswaldense TaxID=55518 RepID=A4TVN2_9PROT|nr:riboflavin synthase [Magnetospirillum gryphiswaldense]AVM73588.1 Riboflavin synthase [Magnetospirillum gryphiswaldense MSR-1]AVM77491.1 Riboflavin synthase [Magnetospirillum gryphiswaldense]CAM74689.1 riboflavin synthase, alpha subunit [Magnetospirillum gryphiswaldense MSR-1]
MFTGIVTDLGAIRRVVRNAGKETRFEINTAYDLNGIDIGASIAHNGVCLTIVDKGADWYAVEVSAESISKTTLGDWVEGGRINLERAMKVGDELGGHIVSGHVDGVATVVSITDENESKRFVFEAPENLAKFVAPKGSVALDGVSLTVNEVDGRRFGINVIPHTQAVTTFGRLRQGDRVNMEIDMLARYVARLLDKE